MRWTSDLREELERRWSAGEREVDILSAMSLTRGQLLGRKLVYNLHTRPSTRKPRAPNQAAVDNARTIYPNRLTAEGPHLRPGYHSSKLGKEVLKGRWKGMPIYALALEERATCPRDCILWVRCYGNNLHFQKRSVHGQDFERALWRELSTLNRLHRKGFVVRLHVLGDFYSTSYVDFWESALDHFENLSVFGYTARQSNTVIGAMVQRLRHSRWDRFSVRTSGAQKGVRTRVFETAADVPKPYIICPAQTGKTRSCATCGLCWNSTKPVAFLEH